MSMSVPLRMVDVITTARISMVDITVAADQGTNCQMMDTSVKVRFNFNSMFGAQKS